MTDPCPQSLLLLHRGQWCGFFHGNDFPSSCNFLSSTTQYSNINCYWGAHIFGRRVLLFLSSEVLFSIIGITNLSNQSWEFHPLLFNIFWNSTPPEDTDAVECMKYRLQTDAGREVYAKRKSTVEPVFGIIKSVMGFRQFLLRGVNSARGEWNLVCIAYNLKKLHALRA